MATEQDFINATTAADDWPPLARAFADWLHERGDSNRATLLECCADGEIAQASKEICQDWEWGERRWKLLAQLEAPQLVLIAADFAERVLHLFEASYPDDHRPRAAIIAARQCETLSSFATAAEMEKARAAAIVDRPNLNFRLVPVRESAQAAQILHPAARAAQHAAHAAGYPATAVIAANAAAYAAATAAGKTEFYWQAANYLLQLHFGPNDWMIRQHRKDLSQ